MKIPYHSYDLIESLDQHFPEVIYDPAEGREEFLLRSGERRLILRLKALRAAELSEQERR